MTDNGSKASDTDDAITSAIGPMLAELRACIDLHLPDTDPRLIAAIAEKRRLLDLIEAEPTGRTYRAGFRTELVTPHYRSGVAVFTITCLGCEEFIECSGDPAQRGGPGQEAETEWVMTHRCHEPAQDVGGRGEGTDADL